MRLKTVMTVSGSTGLNLMFLCQWFYRVKPHVSMSVVLKHFHGKESRTHLKPPPPTQPSSLTAEAFVTYFEKKVDDISSSFAPLPRKAKLTLTPHACPNSSPFWPPNSGMHFPLQAEPQIHSQPSAARNLKTHLFRLHLKP